MRRIGILGGTFNPIHIGHLVIAQAALDALRLDELLFVPSYHPPHKSNRAVVAARHRVARIKLAIKENKRFLYCESEIKRKGRSYSIDTLEELARLYPKRTKFYFIIGSDMLKGLKRWRRIQDLARLVQFVAVDRKGYSKLKTPYPVKNLPTLDLGISSSYLRQNIKRGKSLRYLLPEKVFGYIKKHRLYR